MKEITKELLFWVVIIAVIAAGMIWLGGCQPQQRADLTPRSDSAKIEALRLDKILEAIYRAGRLVTAFIVVIVVGVFLCKVSLEWGLLTIFAGGVGVAAVRIDQVMATHLTTNPYLIQNPWWILLPIGMALAAGGFWLFKNEQVRTALKQIVKGGWRLEGLNNEAYAKFKNTQAMGQSKPTEKIVREIKAKL